MFASTDRGTGKLLTWKKLVFDKTTYKTTVAQKGQSQINFPKHKLVSQNTNQFPKTQINFPKHKSVSQNTNQLTKTQISFPKHLSISENTNHFSKTQSSLPKHKSISRNTSQFRGTQIKRLGTCSVIIREGLEGTHSQEFTRPTWRLFNHATTYRAGDIVNVLQSLRQRGKKLFRYTYIMMFTLIIYSVFELNDDIWTRYLLMYNACCHCWLYCFV